jgi:hypothetical protein
MLTTLVTLPSQAVGNLKNLVRYRLITLNFNVSRDFVRILKLIISVVKTLSTT